MKMTNGINVVETIEQKVKRRSDNLISALKLKRKKVTILGHDM